MDLTDAIKEFCNFSLVGEYSCPPENLRAIKISEASIEICDPGDSILALQMIKDVIPSAAQLRESQVRIHAAHFTGLENPELASGAVSRSI
jgi:hypothetical protein